MTEQMLKMTEEELINNIVEADRHGRELEKKTREMIDTRAKLLAEADKLGQAINRGLVTLEDLTSAMEEMNKLLREKYGSFVM